MAKAKRFPLKKLFRISSVHDEAVKAEKRRTGDSEGTVLRRLIDKHLLKKGEDGDE